MPADQQVLQQRGIGEQLDVLEGARDPQPGDHMRRRAGDVLPVKQQLAFGGIIDPADQIEDRGLAGAIRADDREDLTFLDSEAHRIDRADTAEPDRDFLGVEQVLISAAPIGRRISAAGTGLPHERIGLEPQLGL